MIAAERELREQVEAAGGFVNAHAHFDRANTLPSGSIGDAAMPLREKWAFVDGVKRESSQEAYERRISDAVESVRSFGTVAAGTFIDVDDVAEDRALRAAVAVREKIGESFKLSITCQTLKGVLDPSARAWFDRALESVDIIGGLPKKDAPREVDHLDVLLTAGKRLGKLVHVHVDQFNTAAEKETELLAQKTIEHGMEGRVWAIHSISLAAHPEQYRKQVYKLLQDAGVGIICCPFAWIDAPRSEERAPTHNAIAPLDELIDYGVPIALGSDNISDVMKPLSTGDMWPELRLAIESCRLYNVESDTLVDIVTKNGRLALGID